MVLSCNRLTAITNNNDEGRKLIGLILESRSPNSLGTKIANHINKLLALYMFSCLHRSYLYTVSCETDLVDTPRRMTWQTMRTTGSILSFSRLKCSHHFSRLDIFIIQSFIFLSRWFNLNKRILVTESFEIQKERVIIQPVLFLTK